MTCPNPACGAEMPLASTWWLSKKKDLPTWIQPVVIGKQVDFEIRVDKAGPPYPPKQGRGAKFTAWSATTRRATHTSRPKPWLAGWVRGCFPLSQKAIGSLSTSHQPRSTSRQRRFLGLPTSPEEPLAFDPRNVWCVNYGLTKFADLFTNRQLVALTTFSDLCACKADPPVLHGPYTQWTRTVRQDRDQDPHRRATRSVPAVVRQHPTAQGPRRQARDRLAPRDPDRADQPRTTTNAPASASTRQLRKPQG